MSNADDALAAAEAAEAEAAEAEALAAAARARTRALRLRREAEAAAEAAAAEAAETEAVDVAETVSLEKADEKADQKVDEKVDDAAETVVAEVDSSAAELDEPSVEETTSEGSKRRLPRVSGGVWRFAAATLLIIGTVALLVLSGAAYLNHRNVELKQQKQAEFAAAARQGVVTLMSLDFNRAQEDVDRIIGITTGDFKKDFENQAEDFVRVAQEAKVVTEATVNAVAVQKMTDDTATVLLAAMSRVSNISSDKQEPRAWRLSVDVARDGDQIKLAKVEFVP